MWIKTILQNPVSPMYNFDTKINLIGHRISNLAIKSERKCYEAISWESNLASYFIY